MSSARQGLFREGQPGDAVLLDLMMPGHSGFELCQRLRSLSFTSRLPIFIISGQADGRFREYCRQLGASAFFEKQLDFTTPKGELATQVQAVRPERRAQARVKIRVSLRLQGVDVHGDGFDVLTTTENVSAGGILCPCSAMLQQGSFVEVLLMGEAQHNVGHARVARTESSGAPWLHHGFVDKNQHCMLK